MNCLALDLGFAKGDGGRPGAFLQYGAGARSLGLGKTFVGIADDASAVYWNPAGLAQLKQKELVALQNKLYVDTDYSFLAFATPLKIGTVGIGLVNLNSTGFQLRDEYNYALGEGGVNESAALVSFAKQFTINRKQLAIGATAKIVKQNVDSRKDTGYGVDIGLLSNHKNLNLGFALQNIIAPRILLKNKEDIYPLSVTLGIGYKALQDKLLLTMDINKTENRSLKFHLGSEYVIANLFALRAGIDETAAAVGAGVKWRNYALDYAFAYHDAWKANEDLGASHRFGLTVKWGKQKQMTDSR